MIISITDPMLENAGIDQNTIVKLLVGQTPPMGLMIFAVNCNALACVGVYYLHAPGYAGAFRTSSPDS